MILLNDINFRDQEESGDNVDVAEGHFEMESEPKITVITISNRGAKPEADQDRLLKENKTMLSVNQFCGILMGILTCFIVFMPVILSWGYLAINAPQRPLVWSTANSNHSVAIKVFGAVYIQSAPPVFTPRPKVPKTNLFSSYYDAKQARISQEKHLLLCFPLSYQLIFSS